MKESLNCITSPNYEENEFEIFIFYINRFEVPFSTIIKDIQALEVNKEEFAVREKTIHPPQNNFVGFYCNYLSLIKGKMIIAILIRAFNQSDFQP